MQLQPSCSRTEKQSTRLQTKINTQKSDYLREDFYDVSLSTTSD